MKVLKWPREVGERGRQSSRGIKRSTCPDGPFKFHKPTFRINNGGREQRERSIFSTSANKIFHPWNVDGRRLDRVDRWKKEMIETQKRGRGEGFPEWKREEKVGRLGGSRVAKWCLVFRGNDWISRVPARSVTEVPSTLVDRDRRMVARRLAELKIGKGMWPAVLKAEGGGIKRAKRMI